MKEVWIEIILQWKYLHILSSLPVKEVCIFQKMTYAVVFHETSERCKIRKSLPVKEVCIFQKMTYAVVFHETSERCKIRNISLRFIVLRYFL